MSDCPKSNCEHFVSSMKARLGIHYLMQTTFLSAFESVVIYAATFLGVQLKLSSTKTRQTVMKVYQTPFQFSDGNELKPELPGLLNLE